ncbi:hypothetical protein [Anaeromicrobium sediminis]|uniref:hypothetical protein n=1 Tax=Anaeromicrobium sediminis TaxID=1478221 RepID=UPI0015955852|nr:hypothetical protein [Anaeromicrobium sediminis]
MNNELDYLETELKVLCINVISMLNGLKEKGFLSNGEYLKHVDLKKKLLQGKL